MTVTLYYVDTSYSEYYYVTKQVIIQPKIIFIMLSNHTSLLEVIPKLHATFN